MCGATQELRACHIVPLYQGGSYDLSNGVTLCAKHDAQTERWLT